MTTQNEASELHEGDLDNSRVQTTNPEAVRRAERLKEAVKLAGGNLAVATKASVPLSTLNSYLSGREMKLSTAVPIAAACNVRLDWLATGDGPMTPGRETAPAEPQKTAPLPPPTPFAGIDVAQLAKALQAAASAFQTAGKNPSMHQLAQITALLYGGGTTDPDE